MTSKCILCDIEGVDFGSKPDYNKYDTADPSGKSYGIRRYYSFLKCPKCELFWVKDPDEDYNKLYESEEYWWNYHKRRGWNSLDETPRIENDIKYSKLRVPIIQKFAPDAYSYLEIGCSTGTLLKELKDLDRHFMIIGVEPNDRVANQAANYSRCSVIRNLNHGKPLEYGFSVVIAIDVLEHLLNPLEEAKKWVENCSKGGIIFLELPDSSCSHCLQHGINWHDYVVPTEHIYYYRPEHVENLMKVFGCKLIHFDNPWTTDRQRLIFQKE